MYSYSYVNSVKFCNVNSRVCTHWDSYSLLESFRVVFDDGVEDEFCKPCGECIVIQAKGVFGKFLFAGVFVD